MLLEIEVALKNSRRRRRNRPRAPRLRPRNAFVNGVGSGVFNGVFFTILSISSELLSNFKVGRISFFSSNLV